MDFKDDIDMSVSHDNIFDGFCRGSFTQEDKSEMFKEEYEHENIADVLFGSRRNSASYYSSKNDENYNINQINLGTLKPTKRLIEPLFQVTMPAQSSNKQDIEHKPKEEVKPESEVLFLIKKDFKRGQDKIDLSEKYEEEVQWMIRNWY
jgi:hypothetical protein